MPLAAAAVYLVSADAEQQRRKKNATKMTEKDNVLGMNTELSL
jgi:hypothetical protein